MAVYLIYAGVDLASYLCELEVLPNHKDPIADIGWRTIVRPGLEEADAFHVALANGSIQVIIRGAMDVGVTAGDVRQVTGKPGDTFVFLDVEGDGHSTRPHGGEMFAAINIRVTDDWAELRRSFDGWPADMRPYPASEG